jgi:hypothetical protein
MTVIAFVSQYGFQSRNAVPTRIQIVGDAGLQRCAIPPYPFLFVLLVFLLPSDEPLKARLVVVPCAGLYWLQKTLKTKAFSG